MSEKAFPNFGKVRNPTGIGALRITDKSETESETFEPLPTGPDPHVISNVEEKSAVEFSPLADLPSGQEVMERMDEVKPRTGKVEETFISPVLERIPVMPEDR